MNTKSLPLLVKSILVCKLLIVSNIVLADLITTNTVVWTAEPGQVSTSGYMILIPSKNTKISNLNSTYAERTAFFKMYPSENKIVMKMQESLNISAGEVFDFTQEGYQLILSGIKKRIDNDNKIPVTFDISEEGEKPKQVTIYLHAKPFDENNFN